MAHLEKLFAPEGRPDNPYQSYNSRATYKSETATAEIREVNDMRPLKKEFHPITTEIHVTELRPIKLDPLNRTDVLQSTKNKSGNNTWERRLMSEGNTLENGHRETFRETHMENRRSHSTGSSGKMEMMETNMNNPGMNSTMIRTVTSRTGSHTGSPRDKGSAEFRRRGKF